MGLNIRSISVLAGLASLASMASASGIAFGGADNQTWVLNTGPDITYFTESINYFIPGLLSGSGSANYSNTTNNPVGSYPTGGGTYFNTNSGVLVSTGGSAYEESGMGEYLFFSNPSANTEYVTLGWQGFVTASCTATLPAEGFDYAESYILDGELDIYGENVFTEATSPGVGNPPTQFGQGEYTFAVAPGEKEYEIVSLAYNEAEVTPEPAPIAALGLGALGLSLKRRKK